MGNSAWVYIIGIVILAIKFVTVVRKVYFKASQKGVRRHWLAYIASHIIMILIGT